MYFSIWEIHNITVTASNVYHTVAHVYIYEFLVNNSNTRMHYMWLKYFVEKKKHNYRY